MAANPNRVVGQAKVTLDGQLLDTDGSTTLDVGGPKREGVSGDYQAGAFRQSTEASKVDVNLLVKASLSLSAIRAVDNSTLMIEFDTGQTFLIRNAWSADVPSVATNDGKAKCVFQGPPAEEMA